MCDFVDRVSNSQRDQTPECEANQSQRKKKLDRIANGFVERENDAVALVKWKVDLMQLLRNDCRRNGTEHTS